MVAFSLLFAFALGGITHELCKWWYGRPPPFAVVACLAFVVDASLAAAALTTFSTVSFEVTVLYALASGIQGCLGADLARGIARAAAAAAAPRPQDEALQLLAPSTVWPPDLQVESISPSAPVPPTFVCPITMAPMANPAITPRGTSYDREALCDWITKHHRYPGGEARAAPPHRQACDLERSP